MAHKSYNPVSDRFTVIAVAVMIVLYLAFGRAMADEARAPEYKAAVMKLPISTVPPTGEPNVIEARYDAIELRKAQ